MILGNIGNKTHNIEIRDYVKIKTAESFVDRMIKGMLFADNP
jgi:hypothetical protein